jgi:predicted membrane-bound spermidine synthase
MTRAPRGTWLLVVAALAGAAVMGVEISAVRVLAPWFGASLVVWTNVLEVILLGLAIGYLLGARLSVAELPLVRLTQVLVVGAVLVAWLPAGAGPVCGFFLPEEIALHDAAPLLLWGSLAAALVLFLPPAVVLGAVGPLLVEELHRRQGVHAGTAGGRVLCASTVGSVLGAFATSHFLIPHPALGLARTFALTGVVLAGCALAAWMGARRGRPVAAGAALLLAIPALFGGRLALPEPAEGVRELASAESRYQLVRAVEDDRYGTRYRYLQVNEGFDSFQSVWREELGLIGEGFYYDDFVLPAWWSRRTGADGPFRVLVLGFGAGTVDRVMRGALPEGLEPHVTGIEIDPAVVELGRRFFDLEEGPSLVVHGDADARFALRGLAGPFDEVVLDAYANQVEIPPHLSTTEFFAEVRERLAPGGWLVANVGGFGFDDPVVRGMAETVAHAFEREVLVLRVPSARNYTLVVRHDADVPRPGTTAFEVGGPVGEALLPARELEGGWSLVAPPARAPLTDDRNPIEALQAASLRAGRERLRDGA